MCNNNLYNNISMEYLIKKIAIENNITNHKIETTAGSKKGDGFVAKLLKIDLVGTVKTLHLIGKTAPKNKEYRKQIPVKLLYGNEIYFYETVVQAFRKIFSKTEFNLSLPRYYGSNKTEFGEVLLLENLLASNYTMWSEHLINHDDISLVLKEYGKLHACSFAIKERDPHLWGELIAGIEDVPGIFFSKTDYTDSVFEQCQNVVQALRSRKKHNLADKLEMFRLQKLKDVMNNSGRYLDKYSIIAHGDGWCNNYMFQYEDSDNRDKPTAIKLIDFQIVRVGSPVIDVSYLLYTCLQKEGLISLDKYLKIYYSSLVEAAQDLNCDINLTYPYEVFMQHWKKFSSYGFAMTLVVLHGMMSKNEEFPDFEDIFSTGKGLFVALNFISVNEDKYYDRIIDIVEHFVKCDFL